MVRRGRRFESVRGLKYLQHRPILMTIESLSSKEGLAGRVGQTSENSANCRLTESTEHLPGKEGPDLVAEVVSIESRWKLAPRCVARRTLGTGLGDKPSSSHGATGSGDGWLRRRPERVDELDRVGRPLYELHVDDHLFLLINDGQLEMTTITPG